jgi:hypothetical protein
VEDEDEDEDEDEGEGVRRRKGEVSERNGFRERKGRDLGFGAPIQW